MPRVATTLSLKDHLGTVGARTGLARNDYRVTPGLYCVGSPGADSPVLVSANYKLTFDALRQELADIDAWLLIIDSRGVNVWCAAGKGTFSCEEIAFQVRRCRLEELVSHRRLILPQLAANGVAAHRLKELCGFSGRFGPIFARDLPEYLLQGKASEEMRTVTFTLGERAVLVPLEICLVWKKLAFALPLFLLLSGIGPEPFALHGTLSRFAVLLAATLVALVAGAVLVPLLLPWVPCRRFWIKGLLVGAALCLPLLLALPELAMTEQVALVLWVGAGSSFMAMNFTGSTPYTSLSGVSQELRGGLIFQLSATFAAAVLWPLAAFLS